MFQNKSGEGHQNYSLQFVPWLLSIDGQLGFSEIQAELANLPILPNFPAKFGKFAKSCQNVFKFYFLLEYLNFIFRPVWINFQELGTLERLGRLGKLGKFSKFIPEKLKC